MGVPAQPWPCRKPAGSPQNYATSAVWAWDTRWVCAGISDLRPLTLSQWNGGHNLQEKNIHILRTDLGHRVHVVKGRTPLYILSQCGSPWWGCCFKHLRHWTRLDLSCLFFSVIFQALVTWTRLQLVQESIALQCGCGVWVLWTKTLLARRLLSPRSLGAQDAIQGTSSARSSEIWITGYYVKEANGDILAMNGVFYEGFIFSGDSHHHSNMS